LGSPEAEETAADTGPATTVGNVRPIDRQAASDTDHGRQVSDDILNNPERLSFLQHAASRTPPYSVTVIVLRHVEGEVSTLKVVLPAPAGRIRLPIGSKIMVGAVVTTVPLSERACQAYPETMSPLHVVSAWRIWYWPDANSMQWFGSPRDGELPSQPDGRHRLLGGALDDEHLANRGQPRICGEADDREDGQHDQHLHGGQGVLLPPRGVRPAVRSL
jgi:hypothetical protein